MSPEDKNRNQVGILIIESIDILYNMLDLIEEMYLDGDSKFGEYITSKMSVEKNIQKLLNK